MSATTNTTPAKIVLVHGMNMQKYDKPALERLWYTALIKSLKQTDWGKAHDNQLPKPEEVKLAYWADLFKWPKLEDEEKASKGLIDTPWEVYYDFCRGLVRVADKMASFNHAGRPSSAVAAWLDKLVAQTAVYMHNGPVYHPTEGRGDGAFKQVQARFEDALTSETKLVIGHSLGSVVAYEGLCRNPHRVPSFITVGSPLASPDLILEPLRQRSALLHGEGTDGRLKWPGVERWTNFYAGADVWCVPVEGLAQLFPDVQDRPVDHGSTLTPSETHAFTSYLENHIAIGEAIAEALDR